MSTATRHVNVRGRVQGIGYRAWAEDEALARGLEGWVRNRRDGSVEAQVEGEEAAVQALLAWARRGPRAARVSGVRSEPAEPLASAAGFEILPSA